RDYAEWQNSDKQKEAIKRQEKYWLNRYAGELPVLSLPTDYPRPEIQSFAGKCISFMLNDDETEALKETTGENDATLYMTILSVFVILLSKLSGQKDIVIGTPTAGRRHTDLENLVGMFVNTLAMRNDADGEKSVKAFFGEVKENTLNAFENQEYQFEDLVENLSVNRNTGRNPVFDVMLNLLNQPGNSYKAGDTDHKDSPVAVSDGTPVSEYEYINTTSKFDLNLNGYESERSIKFQLEYCTRLFKAETIERFIVYFKTVLRAVSGKTGISISDIAIISEEEKTQILCEFNGIVSDYPVDGTVDELFEVQAAKNPDTICTSGVGTQKNEGPQVTYGELNRRAGIRASLLREKGVTPGTVAAIMVERSIEMIIGIISIIKAGGVYLPIDPTYPGDRITYMLEDSKAAILLTDNKKSPLNEPFPETGDIVIHDLSREPGMESPLTVPLPGGQESRGEVSSPSPAQPLYVIYTSGSTGRPKGVVIEHRNLVNLINFQFKSTSIDFSRVLQFTTIGFDVAAQEIFSTLLSGGRLSLIARETLSDIPALFDLVRRDQIKTLFFPASFLMLTMNDDEFVRLIPHVVRHIVTAGEQVVVNDKFREYLQREKVYLHNHYGPSETHVVTTLTLEPEEKIPTLPSIGNPIANTQIYIMDKGQNLLPQNIAGELYIGGAAVGRGYLNNPELTAERFAKASGQWAVGSWQEEKQKTKKEERTLITGNTLYRTGDLARWLPGGNIEFLGRIDQQVKIRGHRVELGEIESRLLSYPAIDEAVVLARQSERGDYFLCAYYVETGASHQESGIRDFLSKTLPDYMLPSFYIKLEKIPLTPNGKIDHKALSQHQISNIQSHTYTAPRNEIEEKLTLIWADVLGHSRETLGMDEDFFQVGGHSLKAMVLAARIHKELNIKLPLTEIFKHSTIRTLGERIKGKTAAAPPNLNETFTAIKPAEKKEYYLLSSAQKRQYILQQMELDGTAYNMSHVTPLRETLSREKLENTFKKLIRRHESLRTSFHMIPVTSGSVNPVTPGGVTPGREIPVQVIHDDVAFKIETFKIIISGNKEKGKNLFKQLQRKFFRSFDLSRAPLLRVGLVEIQDKESDNSSDTDKTGRDRYLLIDMHHIITDGTSRDVLIREFNHLNKDENLLPLKRQYKDYTEWQNSGMHKRLMKQQEAFWLNAFSGELPVLELPTDYPRPVPRSFEGQIVNYTLNRDDTAGLMETMTENKITLYMALFSLFSILLSKLSGQQEIIVGTPTAGRRHADLESIIGMFVNTLPMRNYPSGEKTFKEYLAEVKNKTLAVFENQEYQFEDLVDKLSVRRDTGRNPIFDAMFNLLNKGKANENNALVPVEQKTTAARQENVPGDVVTSKVDLSLNVSNAGENICLRFEYCTKLFKEETIRRFITYFTGIMRAACHDPHRKIGKIEIITEEEKRQILYEYNNTEADYPRDKTIHELFAQQAARTPDSIGPVGSWQYAVGKEKIKEKKEKKKIKGKKEHTTQITYRELNEKSNRLARRLQEKGAKPGQTGNGTGTIVAIMLERSIEMIIGLLGILKAGAAYLPIDPGYPEERINYMLKDSNAKLLLVDDKSEIRISKSKTNHKDISRVDVDHNSNDRNQTDGPIVLNLEHLAFEYLESEFVSDLGFRASDLAIKASGLAYIIYTSGSTGKPKGVLIEHRGVIRLVKNAGYIDFTTDDCLLLTGAFVFDVTTFEIWGPLLNGAGLCLVHRDHLLDAEKLETIILKNKISILHLIPRLFNQVAVRNPRLFARLRYFLVGGDQVRPGEVNRLRALYGNLEIRHMYGPTENTTFSTYFPVRRDYDPRIPIGNPLANSTVYIVDKYGNLNPPGVSGEIWVGGDGVARGYLNNPELTAGKFTKTGWQLAAGKKKDSTRNTLKDTEKKEAKEERTLITNNHLYRTGDLGRWLPGGSIEFLGRMDQQVKIRGFRIELGEIENRLIMHPG
ncbi:MAG: amino acid adenylation domain-containing protein, partial [bacterium]|nr:amino acid adenylation domain-containing protein [bacterium]